MATNPGYTGSPDSVPTGGGASGDIISGAVMLAGNLINAAADRRQSRKNTEKTIAANKELAMYQWSKDLEMWNLQNQYNSPAAQMARLKEAGLNPNMMYGSGSAATGNASQLPKYNAPTVDYTGVRPFKLDIGSVLGMYQDFRIRQAQIDNLKANEENIRARTVTESMRPVLVEGQGRQAQTAADLAEYVRPYQSAIIGNKARGSEAQLQQEWQKLQLMNQEELYKNLQMRYQEKAITGQGIENEKKAAELLFQQYRNQWMAQGITSSDNVLLRIFVRMISEAGVNLSGMLR